MFNRQSPAEVGLPARLQRKSFLLRSTGWFLVRFFEIFDQRLDESERNIEGPFHNPQKSRPNLRRVEGDNPGVI
jgi:hypothetical protein